MKRIFTLFLVLILSSHLAKAQTQYGTDDLLISDLGIGSLSLDAYEGDIKYGGGVYLVAYHGDVVTGGQADGEFEIFGQLVNAQTHAKQGTQFTISNNATLGDIALDQIRPDIAYNSVDDEFLVVWKGEINTGGFLDNEFEIWGQRIDASTGTLLGANFQISLQGGVGDALFDAQEPSVAYNATDNEYLVAWSGDRLVAEDEAYGQLVSNTGALVGVNFQISNVGATSDAFDIELAWNSTQNEYMVIWRAALGGIFNVAGQRVSNTGGLLGANFPISNYVGATEDANPPNIAYNATDDEYLVIWNGEGSNADGEALMGQRISNVGAQVGVDDFIIYDPYTINILYDVVTFYHPGIVWDSNNNKYLTTVSADNTANGDQGIFAIEVSATGTASAAVLVGDASGGLNFDFERSQVAFNPECTQYVVSFMGGEAPLAANDDQMYVQFLGTEVFTSAGTPTVLATPNSVCGANTTSLTVTAGSLNEAYEWVWYDGDPTGAGVEIGTGSPLVVAPGATKTYYARGESTCLTPGTAANVGVTHTAVCCVNSSIGSATASTNNVCPSTAVNVTANSVVVGTGATLTWYTGTGGTGSNLGTSNPLAVSPATTTTYFARLAGTCNTVEQSITVTVDKTASSIASATLSANNVCPSTAVNVTANSVVSGSGATLTWFTGAGGTGSNLGGGNPLAVSPATTTTYFARLAGTCNTVEQSVTLTVGDAVNPTMACQPVTIYLNGAGSATIVGGDIDNGSSDNCGTPVLSLSQSAFVCADLGANTVTLYGTDGAGNVDSCSTTVTVADSTSPVANCQNITVFLNGAGTASIVAGDIDNGSTDNCGAVSLGASQTAFTCANLGANAVVLTATDGSGNTGICNATVTVVDTTSPTASCQNITVFLNGAGTASIVGGDIDNGSTDNCGAVSLGASQTSFTCANLGANAVVLTATDGSGNTGTCNATVTVADTTSPTASCQNITVFLDGAGSATIVAGDIDNGSTDNCGAVSLGASQTAFTCANLGANNVTLTVTDGSGNTDICTATVTVSDTTSPSVTCPVNQTQAVDASCGYTLANYTGMLVTSDNCGAPVVTQSPLAASAQSGTTVVTLYSTDASGNVDSCSFSVLPNDMVNPTMSCQTATIFLNGAGNATLTTGDIDNGSSDNCGIPVLSLSQAAFTCANIGGNAVTLYGVDGSGNTDSCTTTVTVSDTTSPTASCQNVTVFLNGAGTASIVAGDIDNGSSDNCGAVSLGASITAFSCADLGTNNVTLTVTDGSGNVDSCVAVVTVVDTISPTASCQNITVFLNGAGNATIVAGDVDNGSADNCGAISLGLSQTSFTCADLGANAVVLTATDGSANTGTCNATVTVVDTISPTASCQNITVFLNGAGNATIVAGDVDNGSADNCGAISLGLSQTSFTCADLGANAVVLTATDGSANTGTCNATVTVVDTISPTASCQNITVFLNGAGNATIVAGDVDNGSADNCGAISLGLSQTSFTCADLGANAVVLTATDGSANTGTCNATVTVVDTTSPTASCQNITVFLNGAGTASIVGGDIDNGSTDNCGAVSLGASQTSFTCADLGANAVVLTATDGSANTGTCNATVTVSDTISPTASCQNISVFLNGAGTASIVAGDIDNGSSDNCGAVSLGASITAFSCADLGTNNVTLTVTDGSGNVDSCVAVVTIIDTISPTASCQNVSIFLNGAGTASVTAGDIDNGSTDNCGAISLGLSQTSFTCADLGANAVVLTATDGSANTGTCNATVTVVDTISPTASCQNITVFLNGAGNATIVGGDVDNGSTDNCGAISLGLSHTSFTCANIGGNAVTLYATDATGNVDSCTATVTVSDTISPTASCQNISVFLNGAGTASIVAGDIDNGSSDNCGAVSLGASITAFSCADLGTNNVTLTVTDGSGNVDSCVAVVTIIDTISPTASCQNVTIFLDGSGNASTTAAAVDNGSADNCGAISLGLSQTSFTCADLGANAVVLTATDGSANTGTCNATVTVSDTISPTASCQNISVFLNGAGTASIVAGDIDNGSSDNCGAVSLGASITAFSCADLGTNNVTLTVTDGSGNVDSCVAVVTIIDTISPTASCQNVSIFLNGAGTASVTAGAIDNGSTDNCGAISLGLSQTSFTCADLGANAVVLTATDGSANTGTCNATVTVVDTISPTASCQNITVFLNGAGNATIVAGDVDNGSADNCGAISLGLSQTAFTCANIGGNAVTLYATDATGNVDSCTATVTVSDTISPTASCQNISVFLNGAGTASIVAGDIDNGSSDNCGAVSLGASITAFSCADLGTNNVTLTVTDGSGNVDSCVAVVTIIDTISPTASCQNVSIFLNGAGTASVTAGDIDNGSTDNCGAISLGLSQTSFTCADLGANAVVLTATDGSANTGTCNATVTVVDTISPTASCQNVTLYLNAGGTATLTTTDVDNGSADNCGTPVLSLGQTAFTCTNLGTNSITFYATDASGNVDSCTTTVTIEDTIAPSVTCPGNQNQAVDASCGYSLADYTGLMVTSDNCTGSPIVSQSPASGTAQSGTITVTLYATDGSGNVDSCTFDVIPNDTIAPVITCLADQMIAADANCMVAIPDYASMASGTDNCGTPTISQNVMVGTLISSTTVVTLYAMDATGNIDSCSFNVSIADSTAPVVTCPADQTEIIDTNCEYMLSDYTGLASVVDNCDGAPVVTQSPASGTTASGVTIVTIYGTDASGNVDSCMFNVNPSDTVDPVIICPSNIASCDDVITYADPTFSDNCSATLTQTDASGLVSGDQFPEGITMITYEAADAAGNVATCSIEVSVLIKPVIDAGQDEEIDRGESIFIDAMSDSTYSFDWSPATGLDNPTTLSPSATPDQTTTYVLTATSSDSCAVSDSMMITVHDGTIVINNTFTPNNDGKNDLWIIEGLPSMGGCSVQVFNRWGTMVFEDANYQNNWDGRFNGNPLPEGAYYYVILCAGETEERTGSVTILTLNR